MTTKNETAFCDLHFHTHFSSDAYNDPETALPVMRRSGVRIIAPTDHDAVEANAVFGQAAAAYGIRVVTGVELDTDHPDLGHLHIMGYGFDPADPGIVAYCDREQAAGQHFLDSVLRVMIADGHLGSPEEFAAWGRTHRPRGRIGMKQAWKWMQKRRGFTEAAAQQYVKEADARQVKDHMCPTPGEAIGVIRRAGGVAVLAHPANSHTPDRMEGVIDAVLGLGAIGIEAYTPSNRTEANIACVAAIGRARGVLVTGGSDSHATDEMVPTAWPSPAPVRCGAPRTCWRSWGMRVEPTTEER
ncbi:MAG: PHP domain-containing protein [Planctomycetota bacterium]